MPRSYTNHIHGTLRAVNIARMVDTQAIMAKTVSRDYKNELVSGDLPKLSIKIPGRGSVVEGRVTDDHFQQQTNTIVEGTLTKKSIPIEIGELDASTTIEEWTKEVMNPIKENFSTDINKRVIDAIIAGIDTHILNETAGSANFKDLSNATAQLQKSRMYGKKWGCLDPSIMSQVRTSGISTFAGGTLFNDLYNSFDIAAYGGVEYIGTPDIDSVTYPAAFPNAISGSVASGAKKLPLAAAQRPAADIPAGVLFTIAGVNAVDAEGLMRVGQLKTFVTDFTPAGSETLNLRAPLIFTPEKEDGKVATQVKNVSRLPANNAAITLFGTLGKTYLRGVVYSENIAAIINRPLTEKGKSGNGVVSTTTLAGMASIQWWERIGDNANGDIWQSVSRLDAAFPLMGIGGTAYYVAAS
jgi:hypothetical protein